MSPVWLGNVTYLNGGEAQEVGSFVTCQMLVLKGIHLPLPQLGWGCFGLQNASFQGLCSVSIGDCPAKRQSQGSLNISLKSPDKYNKVIFIKADTENVSNSWFGNRASIQKESPGQVQTIHIRSPKKLPLSLMADIKPQIEAKGGRSREVASNASERQSSLFSVPYFTSQHKTSIPAGQGFSRHWKPLHN